MRPIVFLAALLVCQSALAENEKLAVLKLKDGKEYSGVTITKRTADGISIMHESGTARVKFEQLPVDLVKQLGGFDPDAAAKARAEGDAKEAAALAEIERGMAAQGEADSKTAVAKDFASSKWARVKIVEKKENGTLCKISWFDPKSEKKAVYSEETHFLEGVTPEFGVKEIFVSIVSVKFNNPTGPNIKHWKATTQPVDITAHPSRYYRPSQHTGGPSGIYFPPQW